MIMVNNLRINKILWGIPSGLAFLAALAGVLFRDIYIGLFPADFLPGAFPQDILTLFECACLFPLIVSTKQGDFKKQIVILGLLGSLFYLYGIYTIERIYNWFYLLYAMIFASSFWAIVSSLSGFKPESFSRLRLDARMLKTTATSSIVIAAIFTMLWIAALFPLMRDHRRIENLYSIYILDLCFIMPAFFITGFMSFRRMPLGILMMPAILISGFFVIFPLGLNEVAKAAAGMEPSYGPMAISFAFAGYMLIIASLQIKMIQV